MLAPPCRSVSAWAPKSRASALCDLSAFNSVEVLRGPRSHLAARRQDRSQLQSPPPRGPNGTVCASLYGNFHKCPQSTSCWPQVYVLNAPVFLDPRFLKVAVIAAEHASALNTAGPDRWCRSCASPGRQSSSNSQKRSLCCSTCNVCPEQRQPALLA